MHQNIFYLRVIRALKCSPEYQIKNTDQTRQEFPEKHSGERLSPFWRRIYIASGAFFKLQQPYYRQFTVKGKRRTYEEGISLDLLPLSFEVVINGVRIVSNGE